MQTTNFEFAKKLFLTSLAVAVLTATPVFAKDVETISDSETDKPMLSMGNPTAMPSLGTLTGGSASSSELAIGNASLANDSLSGFGPSSGTLVGNRALELRDEVLRLRSSVNLNSNQFALLRSGGAAGAVQYHSTVAAITARLQNGTTRGNPILMRQWEEANSSLDEVTSSLSRLNSLLTAVDSDASITSYLLQSVQAAFELSGAVDEDHDQLKLLRDEVNRMVVQLDYLRTQTTNDIQRQSAYLTTERGNLQALAFAISRGEMLGNSLANRPVIVNPPLTNYLPGPGASNGSARHGSMPHAAAAPVSKVSVADIPPAVLPPPTKLGVVGSATPMSPRELIAESAPAPTTVISSSSAEEPNVGRLLVLIRYNQPEVEYQSQLSNAIAEVMSTRPQADFSIVAVSPASGDPAELARTQGAAKRNAEDVRRSLVQMGLSPARISVAHTQMQSVEVPEVHVYVK